MGGLSGHNGRIVGVLDKDQEDKKEQELAQILNLLTVDKIASEFQYNEHKTVLLVTTVNIIKILLSYNFKFLKCKFLFVRCLRRRIIFEYGDVW